MICNWQARSLRPSPSRPPPYGGGGERDGRGGREGEASLRKIKLLGPRIARAAQWPVIAERRRHVAELGVGHHHALHHGRQAHSADLVEVLGPDAIELLGEF